MSKTIVIAERDNIACVLEDKKAVEFYVNRGDVLLNDVFMSRVENVLPSIDAAFVDVGIGKMGFLHAEDIIGKGSLKEKVSAKCNLLVQVTKEPTGHKGPRVTTSISLPGRFLVLMPYETGINVSKKIESSKERARLKATVSLMKPVGVGIIIRTEAQGQSESELQDDLDNLLEKWNNIILQAENSQAPCLLYRDQDLLYRVIREACTEQIDEIIVDTSFACSRAKDLLASWNMDKTITLTCYKGKEPILINYGIDKEIKNALQTKVNLKSGGYLFIEPTEALTVIDVNSGKFTSSSTQDETIFKTNIESTHEIARQLKLRNIGGIVIIDFIDMTKKEHKIRVLEELELALENDKAKPQIGQLSDFGLVELTRHRQGQSLLEMFSQKCPSCANGYVMKDIKFTACQTAQDGQYHSRFGKVKFPNKSQNQNKHKKNFDKNNQNIMLKPQNEQSKLQSEEIVQEEIKEEIITELLLQPVQPIVVEEEREFEVKKAPKEAFKEEKQLELKTEESVAAQKSEDNPSEILASDNKIENGEAQKPQEKKEEKKRTKKTRAAIKRPKTNENEENDNAVKKPRGRKKQSKVQLPAEKEASLV